MISNILLFTYLSHSRLWSNTVRKSQKVWTTDETSSINKWLSCSGNQTSFLIFGWTVMISAWFLHRDRSVSHTQRFVACAKTCHNPASFLYHYSSPSIDIKHNQNKTKIYLAHQEFKQTKTKWKHKKHITKGN